MSATDLALVFLFMVVLSVWISITVWVSVQLAVYGYFLAKRRAKHRLSKETKDGPR